MEFIKIAWDSLSHSSADGVQTVLYSQPGSWLAYGTWILEIFRTIFYAFIDLYSACIHSFLTRLLSFLTPIRPLWAFLSNFHALEWIFKPYSRILKPYFDVFLSWQITQSFSELLNRSRMGRNCYNLEYMILNLLLRQIFGQAF